MAQCPVCQAGVPDEFGLIECEACGAQLIVHVDGQVEHSGSAAAAEASPEESDYVDDPGDDEGGAQEYSEEPYSDEEAGAGAASAVDTPQVTLFEERKRQDEYEAVSADELPAEEYPAEEFAGEEPPAEDIPPAEFQADAELPAFDGSEPAVPEPEPEVYRPPGTSDSPDLSDIAQFGNSDASSGREGALRYNLRIGGIDTSDVREALREALTDRKFMWDVDQILRAIRNGEVNIQNVSAPKAFMLISRLRSLPVRISWEQYAVHQA